ncbi:MAG: HAD hydrolase-like protein [Actinomycetota bacterium]
MTAPAIALFDVDGTLLETGGAGARSWAYAFARLHGIDADITAFSEAGQTDPVVARETFRGALGRDPSEEELGRLYAVYLRHLADAVRTSPGYRVLPSVPDVLDALTEAGVMLGIVSGNLEGAARVKLGRGDLNRYFVFGGYGSDSDDRSELTRAALDRAEHLHGRRVPLDRVVVVGDTPRDVAAAHGVGVVSVAVATGAYGVDELTAAAGADHVVASFEEGFPALDG